jgi:hypothetical protein
LSINEVQLVDHLGGNVLALARMLGHESPKMTLETYGDNASGRENVPGTLEQTA